MLKHVMVVDSDPKLVKLCSLVLEKEGYEVLGALDATQCLDSLTRNHIDLILLDLMLDGSDGWDLLSELQANSRWKRIPVVVVSSMSRRDAGASAPSGALAGYVRKPFPIAHLLEQVKNSLAPVV